MLRTESSPADPAAELSASVALLRNGWLATALIVFTWGLWLAGCSFDSAGLGECRSDGECGAGRCLDRVCVAGGDVSSDLDTGPVDGGDDPDVAGDGDDVGCTPGCDGEVAVTCPLGAANRLDCSAASTCPDDPFGCRCEAAACVPRVCEAGAFGCADADRIQCNADGSSFDVVETCGLTDVCVGGTCVDAACEPGVSACLSGVLVDCSDEGTLVVGPDCELAGMRCDADLGECRCGDGSACETDEACSDPDDGDCLCDGLVCDEGELCDGANGCRCGTEGPNCAAGATCVADGCVCPSNRFGLDCAGVCPTCTNGTCNDGALGSGTCNCPAGFFGATCAGVCACQNDATCADGAAGNGACTCAAGFFGTSCEGVCACQNDATCADGATGNGACTCAAGFFGTNCAGVCDCQNGAACADGVGGDGTCTCAAGFYGANCSNECDCQNGAACDDGVAGTGVCTCLAGFFGADCEGECDCQNGGACDDGVIGTGACTCAAGFFGADCSGACDCQNDGACDDGAAGSGACTCAAGFFGADCSGECDCQNDGACDDGASGTGVCTCAEGFYGADCEGVCSCQNDGVCDDGAAGSGACTCPSGFYGADCSGVCACAGDTVCEDGADGDGSCVTPTPLFNVQRGTVEIDGTTVSITTANGDFVAPTGPAFIRFVNTRLSGMGRTSGGASQVSNRWMAWISAVASDWSSVTFERGAPNDECRVTWEIIEYIGGVGGANAMAVRAQGTASFASDGTTATPAAATAGVANASDVVVVITGQHVNSTNTSDTNRGLATAAWDVATQRPVFTRSETGTTATVSYAVVEFTGSNWSVQRVQYAHTSSAAVETASISSVGDVGSAFLHTQYRSTLGQVDELGAEVWLSAADTLSFRLEPLATTEGATLTSVVWVVSNNGLGLRGLSIDHYGGSRSGGTNEEDCWTETPAAVPNLARTSIWGETARSSGANTQVPRGSISLIMTATDTVSLCQADNGATSTYRYSIVRWPLD